MPFIYAHNECGARTLAQLGEAAAAIAPHRAYFDWGCQGPDPWFFHRIPPLPGRSYRALGSALHKREVGASMAAFLAAALDSPDPRVFAYFAGYLCHYALDCAAHPYVYYRTAHKTHTLFEADIDSALLAHLGRSLDSDPLEGKMPPIDPQVLRAFFAPGAAALGCHPADRAYAQCERDMRFVLRVLYDPTGRKRRRWLRAETLLGVKHLVSRAIFPPRPDEAIDSLNLQDRPWLLPWSGAEQHGTFLGMLSAAADDATAMIRGVYAAQQGGSREAVLQRIGARSFDTGLDWRTDATQRYFAQSLTDMAPQAAKGGA